MIILIIFFVVLAAISKAIQDTLQFHYYESVFAGRNPLYWNPLVSWKNKYKLGDKEKGAKFWGSTTIFVFLTDGWHLFQMLFLFFIFGAVVIYKPIIEFQNSKFLTMVADYSLLHVIFTAVFELFYAKIFVRK